MVPLCTQGVQAFAHFQDPWQGTLGWHQCHWQAGDDWQAEHWPTSLKSPSMAHRHHYRGLEPARSSCESVISRPIKDPSSEPSVANPGLGLAISLGSPGPAPEPTAAQRPRPSPRPLSPCQLSTCCSQWTLLKIPPPCQPPQLPTPPWCARNVIGSILSRPSANSSGWEARYSATLLALVGRTLLVPTPLHPVQRLEGFMHCYS